MIRVSNAYKEAMAAYRRGRGFVNINIGVIDSDAQQSLSIEGEKDDEYTWWSDLNEPITNNHKEEVDYATLEQNFLKCDGTQLFLPEKQYWSDYGAYCVISNEPMGKIRFVLSREFPIKGLTIDFTENYPTQFKVVSSEGEHTYMNDGNLFTTQDIIISNTLWFEIIPITMKGGSQRLRIKTIIMGVGLRLTDVDVSGFNFNEQCYPITDELPATDLDVAVIDFTDYYNIDNPNSFINYLIAKQNVDISIGMTLQDNSIEYLRLGRLWLKEWQSRHGEMNFKATDKLAFFTDTKYQTAESITIHTRTAYEDCVDILTDMGLESDEYVIDEYLKNITFVNPLPEDSPANLLQLIANACRCILYQDNEGRVCIRVNFPYALSDNDYTLSTNTNAAWGSLDNILNDSVTTYYADFTENFSIVDGSMYVLPDSSPYKTGTSYVSNDVADDDGNYTTNPSLTVDITAGFDFSTLLINFAGNPPQEITVHTSQAGVANADAVFTDLQAENVLYYEFGLFDKMTIEVTKGAPNSRTLITYLSLKIGDNYRLRKEDMLSHPLGINDEMVKNVKVRVITFTTSPQGVVRVDDEVYYTFNIADRGVDVIFENPLINTMAMAEDVAKWLGNYYKNSITYEVDYRGEPRLNAGDYIKMDDDFNDNLTTEIIESSLEYSGAFKGNVRLRRAMNEV